MDQLLHPVRLGPRLVHGLAAGMSSMVGNAARADEGRPVHHAGHVLEDLYPFRKVGVSKCGNGSPGGDATNWQRPASLGRRV